MYMHVYKELSDKIMFDLKYNVQTPFQFSFLNSLLIKTDMAMDKLSRGQSELTTLKDFYYV